LTVLIVDDEPSLLESLKMALEFEGVCVLTAESGEAAWQLIGSESVDAVLSDIRMPGISGIELLRRVRAIKPELPFTLMTAYTEIAEEEIQQCGASRVFHKPFDLFELSSWVMGVRA